MLGGAGALKACGAIILPVLDEDACAVLLRELSGCPSTRTAHVSPERPDVRDVTDTIASRTLEAGATTRLVVEDAIRSKTGTVSRHHGKALELSPEIAFLAYDPGDYIGPHVDKIVGEGVPERISEREVLFTLALNDDYEGGDFLVFPEPEEQIALRLPAGSMVIFDAFLPHAVEAVSAGCRWVAVGWFRGV